MYSVGDKTKKKDKLMTHLVSKAKALIVGAAAAVTLGGALVASAPAQAGGFGYGYGHHGFHGYPGAVVVKKRLVDPGVYPYGFYGHPRVVVKKRFVHPGYGFYGRPARVVVRERFARPGYGF